MTLSPGAWVGPYKIVSLLGKGGMGEVLLRARRATRPRRRDQILPPHYSAHPDRLRRFEQKARAAAALNHPNILAIHDTGTHEGGPYIVSELLQGRPPRDIGPCETIDCGRGAGSSQFNLRVSGRFELRGSRLTVIAEGFNLFNATNPSSFNIRRLIGSAQSSSANPGFLQPTSFAGDFQEPVQCAGQLALRLSF
jgi:hypothetical protein